MSASRDQPSPVTSTLAHHAADPFRLMVDAVKDYAIFMLDPAGNVASWNTGAERIKGYKPDEIIGQHFSRFYPAESVAAGNAQHSLQRALAEGRYEEEGQRRRKDGSLFWAVVTTTPLFDHFNNHIGFANVTRDITERRRTELALAESEERHRRLLNVIPDAVFVNSDDRISYCNPAFAYLLGAAECEELLGTPVLSIFHPSYHEIIHHRIEMMQLHNGAVPLIEEEIVRLDGDVIPVEVAATGMTHQGRPSILVVLRDIRQRKDVERRFRALIDGVRDYAIYTLDPDGTIATWNAGATRMFGYTAEEALGRHRDMLFSAGDVAAAVPRRELDQPAEVERVSEECWCVRRDGSRFWAHDVMTVLRDRDGNLRGFVKVVRDLTERKHAETEAARTSELLRAVADGTPDAVFVKDRSGKYLLFNTAAAQFVGKSVAEVLGNDDTAILAAEDAQAVMVGDRLVMDSNQSHTFDQVLHSAGMLRIFEATKAPYRDEDGNVLGVIGISREVTQRKRAEEALRQNQTLLRIAGHAARLGGWMFDVTNQKLTWSDEVCAIHETAAGYQPTLEEAINFYAPEYQAQVADYVRACASEGTPFDFELELITAKGRRIWSRVIGEAVRDSAGQIAYLQGAFQDISERKQAAEAHRLLAERLTTTLESITDGFFTLDREWRFTYVNAEAERMILRQRADLIGFTLWDAFPEIVGSTFEREYRRTLTAHVTVGFEEYFLPLAKWFAVRAYPSEQGLTVYLRDVTVSRQADQAMRLSEERFRLLSKATSDAVWEWDMVINAHAWNEGVTSLFGYPPEEIEPTIDFCLKRVHPDDADMLSAIVYRAIESGAESWTSEYRFRRRDGGYTPVLDCGYIIRNAEGQAIRMLGGMKDLTERHHIEQALRLRDRAIQEVSQGILITDANQPDHPIIYASAGVERLTGYRPDELIGRNCRMFQGRETDPNTVDTLRQAIAAGRICTAEILNYRKDGTPFWNAMSINPIRDDKGTLLYFVGMQSDITEQKKLEDQLRQSQKMDAVGRLAGGVAHDFNNLLTIIAGYSELLLTLPEVGNEVRESVQAIKEAGERAAGLTRQLLGFSRQSMLQPKVLDLNDVVAETGKMLHRLIGEDILFTTILAPNLSPVKVDPSQLDQVLINLAVNARDAMPKGGRLTIETANVLLSDDYVATHLDSKAGQHVMLAITDTGAGMTPDVIAHIFEPFFTTKEIRKGTGLGLAMVFGIVQQSEGGIHVYSEPGHGTTFKIYFPAMVEPLTREDDSVSKLEVRGTETVLLVEDEEGVRTLALRSLEMYNYTVLTATGGEDALHVVQAHDGRVDLVLTDVVMPSIGGPALAEMLKARFPQIRVLFMSGYTDDAVVRHGLLAADVAFIQKPYTPLGLARKVRQVLDGHRSVE